MERIPFETQALEGDEGIMFVKDLDVAAIRFKHSTKEIFVIYEKELGYSEDDLKAMNWRRVKELVNENDGKWTTKVKGIEFLLEVLK